MINKNYNNNFFGWNGIISRKDYAINMFIVIALYIVLFFVNFNAFEPYIQFKFLLTILIYMAELLKMVLALCALSLVYRRIWDFTRLKPYNYQLVMKRLFVFIFVLPVIYLLFLRMFFLPIPFIINLLDILVLFLLLPVAFICSIILCFIKSM